MSASFKKKNFIKYWQRKYTYFIIFNLLFWYLVTPLNPWEKKDLIIHILPLDIIFGTNLGGFFDLNLFELIIYNSIAAIGIYAVSVTVFIFVTGADFWDKGDFQDKAFRWLAGLKNTEEKINRKITKNFIEKEKKEESARNFNQWMFNLSLIFIPMFTKTIVNLTKFII